MPDYIFEDLDAFFGFHQILKDYFEMSNLKPLEMTNQLSLILSQLLDISQLFIPELNVYLLDLRDALETSLNDDFSSDLDDLADDFDAAQIKLNDVNDSISLFTSSPSQSKLFISGKCFKSFDLIVL